MSSLLKSRSSEKVEPAKIDALVAQVNAMKGMLEKLTQGGPGPAAFNIRESSNGRSLRESQIGGAEDEDDDVVAAVPVSYGDRVSFSWAREEQHGYLKGDPVMRRCGMEMVPTYEDKRDLPVDMPLGFSDSVFAIVPMMSYRSRAELRKFNKATVLREKQAEAAKQEENEAKGDAAQSGTGDDDGDGDSIVEAEEPDPEKERQAVEMQKEKNLLDMRNAAEITRNSELLASTLGGSGHGIKYGDTVQLLHMSSELYLKLHKKTALVDKDMRLISMRDGCPGCYFVLMPRLPKTRARGTPVYYDDEIVFESVIHEGLRLHCSHGAEAEYPSVWKSEKQASPYWKGLPQVLKCPDVTEVNGGPDKTPFTVRRYAKYSPEDVGLRTLSMFRIYHPDAEGLVLASCDADKRKFLRSGEREDQSAVHAPYLKKLENTDPSHPENRTSKGVWMFEYENRLTGGSIDWNSNVRIRHVSGKYLSVNTAKALARNSNEEDKEITDKVQCFEASLIDDIDYNAPPGAVGSADSVRFKIMATDTSEGSLPNAPVPVRIVHMGVPTNSNPEGILCYMHHSKVERSTFKAAAVPTRMSLSGEGEDAPKEANSRQKRGEKIRFVSLKSARGILRILPLGKEESQSVRMVSGFVKPLKLFTFYMQNAEEMDKSQNEEVFPKPALDLVDATAGILLRVAQAMVAGEAQLILKRSRQEWLKLATDNLPAKFSKFFTGEPESYHQRIARDTKVIDACFEVAIAAYNRYVKIGGKGKSPFEPKPVPAGMNDESQIEAFQSEDLMGRISPQFISKLAHVCLQRLFEGCQPSQEYFSKRESLLLKTELGKDQTVPVKWTSVISNQSEDPLGATVTLSKLLGSNAEISKSIVNKDLLTQFLGLISNNGPQPRLIQLFSSVCICAGKPIKGNQEMVLRMLWMDEVARTASILKLVEIPQSTKAIPPYGTVLDPSDNKISERRNYLSGDNVPKEDFLGRDVLEANPKFDQVFIEWSGTPQWKMGSDALFWDWQSLSISASVGSTIPVAKESGEKGTASYKNVNFNVSQVPVEWLCWVLEPERLCKPVTGEDWVPYNEDTADRNEREKHKVFQRQCQLADFFVSQLQLITNMAKGRSYNCISWLTGKSDIQVEKGETSDGFSYTMLIGMASNPWLPYTVRSSVIYLLLALYVDRYPQLGNSGRPTLPEVLWISAKEEAKPKMGGRAVSTLSYVPTMPKQTSSSSSMLPGAKKRPTIIPPVGSMGGVPRIVQLGLDDPSALPSFELKDPHEYLKEEDPVLNIANDFKFFLMRNVANDILNSFGGTMCVSDGDENRLACAALSASTMLLSFGFQSSMPKLKGLLAPSTQILDGRGDKKEPDKMFLPRSERFKDSGSANYQTVVAAKKKCIELLSDVSDYRANYRLSLLLWFFHDYVEGNEECTNTLRIFKKQVKSKKENPRFADRVQQLLDVVFKEFEKMFTAGACDEALDPMRLDLAEVTKPPKPSGSSDPVPPVPVGDILLDCTMYDDDELFEMALKLLDRRFGQRRKLLECVSNVYLLDHETIPVFRTVSKLYTKVGFLMFTTRSTENWGVTSKVSGSFDLKRYEFLKEMCGNLVLFLQTKTEDDEDDHDHDSDDDDDWGDTIYGQDEDGASSHTMFNIHLVKDIKKEEKKAEEGETKGSVWGLTNDPSRRASYSVQTSPLEFLEEEKSDAGDDADLRKPSNPHHQKICHSLNLQAILVESLNIDVNIAFKGSRCTLQEKVESERMLIESVEHMLRTILAFVTLNVENQNEMYEHLDSITQLCSMESMLPPKPDQWNESVRGAYPTKNSTATVHRLAKLIVIELCRGNPAVTKSLPKRIFEMFAGFVDEFEAGGGDPTASPDMEFFFVAAVPSPKTPIRRNQNLIVDELLHYKFKALHSRVRGSLFLACSANTKVSRECKEPLKMVKLIRTLADNYPTLQKLLNDVDVGLSILNLVEEIAILLPLALAPKTTLSKGRSASMIEFDKSLTWLSHISGDIHSGVHNSDDQKASAAKKLDRYLSKTSKEGTEPLINQCEELTLFLVTILNFLPKDPEMISDTKVWAFLSNAVVPAIEKYVDFAEGGGSPRRPSRRPSAGASKCTISERMCKGLTTIVKILVTEAASSGLLRDFRNQKPKWRVLTSLCAHASGDQRAGLLNRLVTCHLQSTEAPERKVSLELARISYEAIVACGFVCDKVAVPKPAELAKPPKEKIKGKSMKLLQMFNLTIGENPNVKQKIMSRRYDLVKQLETGLKGAIDDHGKRVPTSEVKQDGQAQVVWTDFVDRVVKYGRAHYFDKNEEHMTRIFTNLRYSLLKARTISMNDGPIDFNDVNPEIIEDHDTSRAYKACLEDHKEKVKVLIDRGVMDLVYDVIATREHGGALSDEAFELAVEMVHAANSDTQKRVKERLEGDYENRFLHRMMARLDNVADAVTEHRRLQRDEPGEETIEALEVGSATLEYLALLCEDHYKEIQNLLREQPGHQGTVNMVTRAISLSILICEDSNRTENMYEAEVEFMTNIFGFFSELTQGPCGENQIMISHSDAVVAIKNAVSLTDIVAPGESEKPNEDEEEREEREEKQGARFELRAAGLKVLKSCLEGRPDFKVHKTLAVSLEVIFLHEYEHKVEEVVKEVHKRQMSEDEEEQLEAALDSLVDLKTIKSELVNIESFQEQKEGFEKDMNIDPKEETLSDSFVQTIEIFWEGRIEKIVFSPPLYSAYLSEASKKEFRQTVDLSTTERRNKELLKSTSVFVAEMKNVSSLASKYAWYRFVNTYIVQIKWFMYGLVVLLNLNVLMSSEKLRFPIRVAFYDCSDDGSAVSEGCEVPEGLKMSLQITWLLGTLNFCGYFVIVGFLALTEIPLMIRETIRTAREAIADKYKSFDDYLDWSAFNLAFVFFGFCLVFVIMHAANFETNPPLYWTMFLISTLWFLKNVRDLVVIPFVFPLQVFTIVYDLGVTKPFLRNHLVLQFFSIMGFRDNQYFTLMLFDIFNNSLVLQDILKAITRPGAQLGYVLYTIVITCIVFATFGFRSFKAEAFAVGDDHGDDLSEDDYICNSTFTCFWYIFYVGVPSGAISDLMNEVTVYDSNYWGRVVYDLAFFIWMGVLLFNIISGLVIDAFGALREEANDRQDTLENTCFVCGITRAAYDDLGLPSDAAKFDEHIEKEHNMWAYVNFLTHLMNKNPADYDGREKYVYDEVNDMSLNWLPNRTSHFIEAFRAAKDKKGDDEAEDEEESED